jgi:O-acetyl-ADP-ribose deacetylase (regulator of RNase III)
MEKELMRNVMTNITYVKGDATRPIGDKDENKVICHICNTKGIWGAGFVMALSKRWKTPEEEYKRWFKESGNKLELGSIQLLIMKDDKSITVCNMIAQEMGYINGHPPIRYKALEICLDKVVKYCKPFNSSIHIPYLMGAGLAGGKWERVEEIIKNTLCKNDINVIVYNFNGVRNES